MQRLALFDPDNTLIDRLDAFRRWAVEFAAGSRPDHTVTDAVHSIEFLLSR